MCAEGTMHQHPEVQHPWSKVGGGWAGAQLRLSTPALWRKQGGAGEALQGNRP